MGVNEAIVSKVEPAAIGKKIPPSMARMATIGPRNCIALSLGSR